MLDFQLQPFAQVFKAFEQELNQNTQNRPAQTFWNLQEDEKAYYLQLDTPGMERDALDIELVGHELVVKWKYEVPTRKVVSGRVRPQHFEHRFKLSEQVDAQNITADYANGVLELRLGKREAQLSRKISISDSSLSGDNLKN